MVQAADGVNLVDGAQYGLYRLWKTEDGKWKTEDFVISEETRGYNIDGAELHQIKYGNFDKIQIKECKCGKKKLTLIEK